MKNLVFERYRDIHKGERVFLIANGPSLSRTNLNLLKNETTIAMNRVSLIYDQNPEWKPTYYLFSSTNVKHPVWGSSWGESIERSVSEKRTTSFIARIFKDWIDPWDEYSHVNWFDSMSEKKPNVDGTISETCFSTDIVERIDKSGTSMNLALQLSYHMGFAEIIIVGADLSFTADRGSTNDPNHFDPSYRADIAPEKVYKINNQMRNVHSLAKKKLLEKDPSIKMFNASLETVLDVYPVIDYEKFVNENKTVRLEEKLNFAKKYWDKTPQFENPIE